MKDYEILIFYETRMMNVKVDKRKVFPQIINMMCDFTDSSSGSS